jgi:lipopolysaccharide export system permease protein
MRILTRYILWEVTAVFLTTLTAMTMFVFVGLVGKKAVENGLGLTPILRMLPYMLPQAMQFAVPGALLMAATSVYGRVASSNEIVAIKSLGVSPMKMIWPTIVLAASVSMVAVVLNDIAVSWGRGGESRVILESLEEIVYGRLRTVKSYSNERFEVHVRGVAGRQLIQPIIQFRSSPGKPPAVIKADAAELHADPATNAISIALFNPEADLGSWSMTHPGRFTQSFPLDQLIGGNAGVRTPSGYALREIGPAVEEQLQHIRRVEHEMAANAATAMLAGNLGELSPGGWQQRQLEIDGTEHWLHRLHTEPHRRWSNGFSCLAFALLGAPIAILLRRGEMWSSFFLCFCPILLLFYPMLVVTVEFAKDGTIPPQVVWLGDVVVALVGIHYIRQAIRFDQLDWRRVWFVRYTVGRFL